VFLLNSLILPQYIHKKECVLEFFFLIVELVYIKKRGLDLENCDCCHKKKEQNQHSRVWPRAIERKLVIENLCCSLYFFRELSLFDLIFSLDSKSLLYYYFHLVYFASSNRRITHTNLHCYS